MAYPSVRVFGLALFSALSVACGHKIGDECETSVDCSQGGERLCDITQPGGYCTVFNCEPDTCPEESACITFGAALSSVDACRDPNQLSRIERAFCMLTCGSSSDCRSGYECVDLSNSDNSWRNALVIDRGRSAKVCMTGATPPNSSEPMPSTEVCTASGSNGTGGAGAGGNSSTGGSSTGGAPAAGAGGESAGGSNAGAGGDG